MLFTSESTTLSTPAVMGPAPTIVEAAKYLGVHKSSIYRLLYRGELKVIAGFARTRISPESIKRFLSRTEDYQASPRKTTGHFIGSPEDISSDE